MRQPAFTLIELIITTALIGLLAVAALPSFDAVQRKQLVDSDLSVIESCFLEANIRAKSPSSGAVTGLRLEFKAASKSCHISELTAAGSTEIVHYNLAGTDYTLRFPNQADQDVAAVEIAATPPYTKRYSGGTSDNVTVELREGARIVGETTYNLDFGTIL